MIIIYQLLYAKPSKTAVAARGREAGREGGREVGGGAEGEGETGEGSSAEVRDSGCGWECVGGGGGGGGITPQTRIIAYDNTQSSIHRIFSKQ